MRFNNTLFFMAVSVLSSCLDTAEPAVKKEALVLETRRVINTGAYDYAALSVNPAQTAIIVVDMWHQGGHGFLKPDKSFAGTTEGYLYQEAVSDSLNETLSAARSMGLTVIHAPADQTHIYDDHPARKKVLQLPAVKYPWQQKPGWNDDQKKVPFASFAFEYEYAYPSTPKERNRPGTVSYGQNPRIVITGNDYITADIEELWNLLTAKNISTLIYMGGSTNMCLIGRPYGILNLKKYGKETIMDRNYAHLVHRVPNGWNGDTAHPLYGPFYTNERNGNKVIHYIEANICPTIDGMDIRRLAQKAGGYTVEKQPVVEAKPDPAHLQLSFQTQLIEIADNYIIDVGWEYGTKDNGLAYGWNRLKVKDGIREGFDPVKKSYVRSVGGDQWKMMQLPASYSAVLTLSGKGKIIINNVPHNIDAAGGQDITFTGHTSVNLHMQSGEIHLYAIKIDRR